MRKETEKALDKNRLLILVELVCGSWRWTFSLLWNMKHHKKYVCVSIELFMREKLPKLLSFTQI